MECKTISSLDLVVGCKFWKFTLTTNYSTERFRNDGQFLFREKGLARDVKMIYVSALEEYTERMFNLIRAKARDILYPFCFCFSNKIYARVFVLASL